MKEKYYKTPKKFILRSPIFPTNNLEEYDIASIAKNKIFQEGVFLSSPGFHEKMFDLNDQSVKLSVYKYWLRACYRCTPFGTFAGVSLGEFSNETNLELPTYDQLRKSLRFDFKLMESLIKTLHKHPEMPNKIKWKKNNSLYTIADKIRYIKVGQNNGKRFHNLATIKDSDYVQSVLNRAENGATINELVSIFTKQGFSEEEGLEFINELIDESILISELELGVTGEDWMVKILAQLKKFDKQTHELLLIKKIITLIKEIEKSPVGDSIDKYNIVFESLRKNKIEFKLNETFKCDLFKPTNKLELNKTVCDDVQEAILFLSKVEINQKTNIDKFKEDFFKRYELNEIPLLEVLDSEVGIGYPSNQQSESDPSPLVDHLTFQSEKQTVYPKWDQKWMDFLYKAVECAIIKGKKAINLKEVITDDILSQVEELLPVSAFSMCSIIANSSEDLDSGNYLIDYSYTSGPSAGNLLGRFCHLDNKIKSFVDEIIFEEEQHEPGKIYAEIIHMAESRLGNILARPSLRKYELPIITQESVDEVQTIKMDDLLVYYDNNTIRLKSKRLNKEIVPRLTTAHNYSLNPIPHYHFLCDLQFQNVSTTLTWNWGPLSHFKHLPRISFGRVILSKERWLISLEDLKQYSKQKKINKEMVIFYFKEHDIPEKCILTFGENHMPLDLNQTLSFEIFIDHISKNNYVLITEKLIGSHTQLMNNEIGSYSNEVIIPWSKSVNEEKITYETPQNHYDVKKFYPGSEWVYVKIYCGVKTSDQILEETIFKVLQDSEKKGTVKKFFFIRFTDPDYHLRVRFLVSDTKQNQLVRSINSALEKYTSENLIWKIQYDTYTPEIKRYGILNIKNSESFFHCDSVSILKLIGFFKGDEGEKLRWLVAVRGVNDLINAFKLNDDDKIRLMMSLSTSFKDEFNFNTTEGKDQLRRKYRKIRNEINNILLNKDSFDPIITTELNSRKKNIESIYEEIQTLINLNKLELSVFNLLSSYIHMFINRLFRSKQRLHEMVIYDTLHESYKSIKAMKLAKRIPKST